MKLKLEYEVDCAVQLSGGLDLLRTTAAALSARDLEDNDTRQSLLNTLQHVCKTLEPLHKFLESCRVDMTPPKRGNRP